jgi:hypothetical protein
LTHRASDIIRHGHLGLAFIDWMVSAEGQNAIRSCRIQGRQLFFPDAQGAQAKKADWPQRPRRPASS